MTKLCQTHECVRSAAGIIDRMDLTKDPCEDFYEFTCGNFIRSKMPPVDRGSRNILQEIQDEMYTEMKSMLESTKTLNSSAAEKAKIFYTSCMNGKANEEEDEDESESTQSLLLELLQDSGGDWCALDLMLGLNSSCHANNDYNFEKRLAESIMNQIPSFVNIYVASPENETAAPYAFHVSLCGLCSFLARHLIIVV